MSKPFYEALGVVESHKAFAGKDTTHHNNYGSYELAKCIVQGIRDAKLPLAKHISSDFRGFDPAHPDPVSKFEFLPGPSGGPDAKPYGN
jgi:hypothetical protein